MSTYTYRANLECAETGNSRTYYFNFNEEQMEHIRFCAQEQGQETIHHLLKDVDWLMDHFGEVDPVDEVRAHVPRDGVPSKGPTAQYVKQHFPQVAFLEGELLSTDGVDLDDMGRRKLVS